MMAKIGKNKRRELLHAILKHLGLLMGSFFMVIPFLWMLSTSFKPEVEVLIWPPRLLPNDPTYLNFVELFRQAPFFRFFCNSMLVSTVSTIVILLTSLVGGFIFAKYRFPGKNFLFLLIIVTAIVPFESYVIPLYTMMVKWKWINTYQGIIAPYLVMSFGIFLLR